MDVSKWLITPENLDKYLENFKDAGSRELVNREFWEGRKVFVTGISGFVGSHLVERLVGAGAEVSGLVRRHAIPDYPNLKDYEEKVQLLEGNLTDYNSVLSALRKVEPSVIFHLGAQSFVPTSFRVPMETYETNVIGTANLLEACRALEGVEAVQVAGSSEEYGKVRMEDVPISEKAPLRPMSPYGFTKVATDKLAACYHDVYGLPTVITRGFNHSGPRRGLQFVTSVIARQVARCALRGGNEITLGKTDSVRDISHVGDIIQGYLLAVEKGKRGTPYNIGHGFGVTIENIARIAALSSGVDGLKIRLDEKRLRPAEVDILICDYSKAKEDFGYRPVTPLTVSIKECVDYFKARPHLLDIERH